MDQVNNIPKVEVTIAENEICNGALEILKVIRPDWRKEDVNFKLLTDGITNKLVRCSLPDCDEEETILVRVYGNKTDLLIDRKAETRNILLLNKVGLAPRLYATFNNGLAYAYVPGCILSEMTIIQPEMYKLVARQMARLHLVQVDDQTKSNAVPLVWKKIDDFLDLVPDKFTDQNKQKRFEEIVIPKSRIKQEYLELKAKLVQLDSPLVFAHNDLLLGNIIYTKEKNSVTFIDFEYAGLNYQAYDIGNHFAEFVGLSEVDYKRYPSKDLQYKWFEEYLGVSQETVSSRDLDRLYVQVNQFVLASHMLWGIWSLIQAEHSYIDFDFMEYAAIRFNEYLARKEEFLSLELPR